VSAPHGSPSTLTIVGLQVVERVGLVDSLTRDIAIAALLGFGLVGRCPAIGTASTARFPATGALSAGEQCDGFGAGLGVGGRAGLSCNAPCAGPILAAVIAVIAASGKTFAVASPTPSCLPRYY